MIQKLLDYEKKILEYRSELNELIQAQNTTNSNQTLIEAKIDYLKQELAYMDNQLNILKAGLCDVDDSVADINSTHASIYQTPIKENAATKSTANKSDSATYSYDNITDNASTIDKASKSTKDFENLMGKNLMGIFASVLIFISFIVFATVILPNLSDALKMFAMYLVSFGFLGLGLFLQKKDIANKLYLSISGCGIGAIYISLLLSNVYFKAIGDITMYILIFIWALFVCYLSYTKSWIFQIIGQIGITIAILFGSILCTETDDWTKLLFLIVFFIASQSMFFVVHYEEEYWDNAINVIGQFIGFFILSNSIPDYYDEVYHLIIAISSTLLTLFALAQIILGLFKFKISEQSRILLSIVNICYFLMMSLIIDFKGEPLYTIVMAILSLVAIEFRFRKTFFGELRIMQNFYALILIFWMYQLNALHNFEAIIDFASFSLLVIPFAIYGFISKDTLYKVFSMIYFTLFIFDLESYDNAHMLLGIALICMYCYLLKVKQYSTGIKTYLYVLTMFFVLLNSIRIVDPFNDATEEFTVFAILCIAHILAIKTPFGKNWSNQTYESKFNRTSSIITAILMPISLLFVNFTANSEFHFMAILIALMLFMINSKNLLQKESMIYGIYVGFKFTIYMIVILYSFTAPDFAISICCLLFAIASIVIGFMMKYKSLRVYGLGLSLLSIVKLIMVDMNYEGSLSRAFSFFVCGILCFVISSIYNYVDKKMSK